MRTTYDVLITAALTLATITAMYLAASTGAEAGTTCTTSGGYTYCNGGGGKHFTCTTSGGYTYCN